MSIVLGFTDRPEGYAALTRAIEEAKLRNEKLVVVHSMVGGSHESADEYIASAEAIEEIHERLHTAGIEHCTHEYVRGHTPAEDLMAAVDDHEAGMLVIGIRRRSTAGKVLLGSNALEILHDTRVPVLCVKAEA